MLYTVQVTISRVVDNRGTDWNLTTYTPQFILDGNVLGITHDEAAEYIAAKMFTDLDIPRENIEVHILKVDPAPGNADRDGAFADAIRDALRHEDAGGDVDRMAVILDALGGGAPVPRY